MSRIGLDSNVLIYFAGVARVPGDEAKIQKIRTLIARLEDETFIAPVQALGELFVVLRRTRVEAVEARRIALEIMDTFTVVPSEPAMLLAAFDLAVDHRLQLWDSLILSAVAEAGCTILLSEDMQHGFVSRGLTIVNPLAESMHPLVAQLLDAAT